MRGKEIRRAVVHDVEAAIAAHPGEQPLHHPADAVWKEAPVARATGRDRDMDGVLQRCLGEGCTLEAAIAEQITLETKCSQPRQRWQDARPVIRVGRVQLEIEQRTVLVTDD